MQILSNLYCASLIVFAYFGMHKYRNVSWFRLLIDKDTDTDTDNYFFLSVKLITSIINIYTVAQFNYLFIYFEVFFLKSI